MAAATMEGSSVRIHSEIFACAARFRTEVYWEESEMNWNIAI
jgi:hypothetical protein